MELFLTASITISFFLGLLIFSKKNRSSADFIFGLWQLILIIHSTLLYIRHSGLHFEYPHFIATDTSFALLHVPFLFFYIRALVGKSGFSILDVLHFVPFLFINVVLGFTFYFLRGEEKITVYSLAIEAQRMSFTDMLMMLQAVGYFLLSLPMVRRYKQKIKAEHSTMDKMNLDWIHVVIYVFAIGFGMNILLNMLFFFKWITPVFLAGLNIANFSILLAFLGYYGIRKTLVFAEPIQFTQGDKRQYARSGISESEAITAFKELEDHMLAEKPFLKSDLTLKELADQMELSTNHLSQVINQGAGKTFYDLVNEYRVNEAMSRLRDQKYEHYKILAIAFDSGFNSKSVFNSFFKKVTQTTPTNYREV